MYLLGLLLFSIPAVFHPASAMGCRTVFSQKHSSNKKSSTHKTVVTVLESINMMMIEDKVDKSNQLQQDRLNHIKCQVLEKIKSTKINKMRNRTNSDSQSAGSKRRLPPSDDEKQSHPSPSRLRTDINTDQ